MYYCFYTISFIRFCTLEQGLKSTAEPMYSSLHLSQVIEYITFLLLQERSPFLKYVLLVTLVVNFPSATK